MKTQKRKVGRPKLKKEVKIKAAKVKPKKKNNGYKDAVLYCLSNILAASEHSLDVLSDILVELNEANLKLDKLITPPSPPMEEPKSEETPH